MSCKATWRCCWWVSDFPRPLQGPWRWIAGKRKEIDSHPCAEVKHATWICLLSLWAASSAEVRTTLTLEEARSRSRSSETWKTGEVGKHAGVAVWSLWERSPIARARCCADKLPEELSAGWFSAWLRGLWAPWAPLAVRALIQWPLWRPRPTRVCDILLLIRPAFSHNTSMRSYGSWERWSSFFHVSFMVRWRKRGTDGALLQDPVLLSSTSLVLLCRSKQHCIKVFPSSTKLQCPCKVFVVGHFLRRWAALYIYICVCKSCVFILIM